MTSPDELADFCPLAPPLDAAVQAVLNEPFPEPSLQRLQERAKQLDIPPTPAIRSSKKWLAWSRLSLVSSGIAVAVLVAVFFAPAAVPAALGEVIQEVSLKPWLHARGTGPDGKPAEMWFSAKEQILASRSGASFVFIDQRLKTMDVFGPPAESNTVLRISLEHAGPGVSATRQSFLDLLSGNFKPSVLSGGQTVLTHEARELQVDGHPLTEHRFSVGEKGKTDAALEIQLQVDPKTKLPVSWTARQADKTLFQFTVSYPEAGPLTIAALGIPSDTPIVDQRPKAEFQQVLNAGRAARQRFDDYFALVIESGSGDRRNGGDQVYKIWRKGDRWRVDVCRCQHYSLFQSPKDTNPDAWWLAKSKELKSHPREIWNGSRLWNYEPAYVEPRRPDPQDLQYMQIGSLTATNRDVLDPSNPQTMNFLHDLPDSYGYESLALGASLGFRAETSAATLDGKELTMVDIIQTMNRAPKATSPRRYFLDPQHGQMMVRKEYFFVQDPKTPTGVSEVVTSALTPRGLWYPTAIRILQNSVNMETGARSDSHIRYYLDFDATIADELFDPQRVDVNNIWTKLP